MIEIVGYIASILIALAMLFNSIVILRWFSLSGSTLFAIYGFVIGAYPVGIVNGFIALTNIYFLVKMYSQKEYFRILSIDSNDQFLKDFLEFNKTDILKHIPHFTFNEFDTSLLVLRNMQVAGVFLAKQNNEELEVKLDYVTKEYRDFKLGKYIYNDQQNQFREQGIKAFVSKSHSSYHNNYLKKLGFKQQMRNNSTTFTKTIAD